MERIRTGAVSVSNPEEIAAINAQFDNMKIELDERTANVLQAQLNYALTTNLTDDWPRYLLPGRFTGPGLLTQRRLATDAIGVFPGSRLFMGVSLAGFDADL